MAGSDFVHGAVERGTAAMDQFYTNPALAAALAHEVACRWPDPDTLFIEPSAGTGAFLRPLQQLSRQVWAIDADPKFPGIHRGDFLKSILQAGAERPVVTIGNPPFGKNASLAVRFFNHAALICGEIAFIVPRTFRKESLQRRLDRKFHLVVDRDVPRNAFIFEGHAHDVPCAWQIWERRACERPAPSPPDMDHLISFTNEPAKADFAVRRVGFYAGRVHTSGLDQLSRTTHYFVREHTHGVAAFMRHCDWAPVATQTVGVRSLSKSEIAQKLSEFCNG